MGCGSSRFGEINNVPAPVKARPLLLRLEEIRIRRRLPEAVKGQCSSSKQGLILCNNDHDREEAEKDGKEHADDTTPKGSKVGSESIEKGLDGDHEDEEDEDDGRKIGRCDSDNYPGSPSFRVYYVEDNCDNKSEGADDELAEKSPIKKDDPNSLHEVSQTQVTGKQVMRKEKKRRNSFKMALPKGRQAKNLFNVRVHLPSQYSNPDRTLLLTAKPHA